MTYYCYSVLGKKSVPAFISNVLDKIKVTDFQATGKKDLSFYLNKNAYQ